MLNNEYVRATHVSVCTSLPPAGKYLSVGNPWIVTDSTSLVVESILAMMMSSLSAYFSASCSQMGASSLQCPHHGASTQTVKQHRKEEEVL